MTTELLRNGDFSVGQSNPPGTYTSQMTIDGWTNEMSGNGRGAPLPIEIINGPCGGDPAHGIAPLPAGHHYFDTEASPGATVLGQSFLSTANQGVVLTFSVAEEAVGALRTNPLDHLLVSFGTGGGFSTTLDISIADFTDRAGNVDYNHLHQFSINAPGYSDGMNANSVYGVSIHETGPGAAVGLVGFAVTDMHAHTI